MADPSKVTARLANTIYLSDNRRAKEYYDNITNSLDLAVPLC
jgi:hypothetical protein